MEVSMDNPLLAIRELGQSVWFDDLSRDLLQSGELERMTATLGISGVTSNPTIFAKSIGKDKTYDPDVHRLVDEGLNAQGIYEALAVDDIRSAADVLAPVYEASGGTDGLVSIEVSPALAYDKGGTVMEGRRLFEAVRRRNALIKVPATLQGIDAAEDLIASGINVNLTLIFSEDQYRHAADAYIGGMKRWISKGGDPALPVSVASVFVSRVDTIVDERLKELSSPSARGIVANLMGKIAIANSKLIYSNYRDIFHGDSFFDLEKKGVNRQKLVWASTSVKNPSYSDTYYVDALIGPETINTMPLTTIEAYGDHGIPFPRLAQGYDESVEYLNQLDELEIDFEQLMEKLLEDGVKAFDDSFTSMLDTIDTKRTRLLRGWGHRSASLGSLQQATDETLKECDRKKTCRDIWEYEAGVWTDNAETAGEIRQRLGWLHIVDTMVGETDRLEAFADEIRNSGFNRTVLIGMGGSSLAPEVFRQCFGVKEGYLDLSVVDTTLPASIMEVDHDADPRNTLYIVSSKSGGTIEVVSLYKHFYERAKQVLHDQAGRNFIAITDPGTTLGKMASDYRFRKVFLNPPDIGGRFSALSYFGLVPAALIGVDIKRLLMRASQAVEASGRDVPALESPGTWLGVIISEAAIAGKDKLTLVISPPVASFGYWLEQLVAESTGKNGKGIIPIEGEPLSEPSCYGSDRISIYLRVDGDSTHDKQVSALEQAGHPVITLRLHGPYDLGREMFRWEFATAVAGAILKINPFDQPNVQESKDITKKLLGEFSRTGNISPINRIGINDPEAESVLRELFSGIQPGSYVAFNAFLKPSEENVRVLTQARKIIKDKLITTTCLGFGPRYLHSTGQIHKGGPNTGLFVVITADCENDVPIPGEEYTFGVLNAAQSLGDYSALANKGRKTVCIHLDSESQIGRLLDKIVDALN
jgi:transaldolase / glucose-6-phosphate isomerase